MNFELEYNLNDEIQMEQLISEDVGQQRLLSLNAVNVALEEVESQHRNLCL